MSSIASTVSARSRARRKRAVEAVSGTLATQETKRAMFLRDKGTSEDEVFDPLVEPAKIRTKGKLPKEDELEEEMRAQSTEELGACIRIELQTVEKIADKSKNLRGDFIKGLRVAARRAEAVSRELAQRASADANVTRLERENAELRARMADLSTKLEKLTDIIRQQQAGSQASADGGAIPAPPPPAAKGNDWEGRFMERIAALMDQKLAAALRAQPSSPQGGAAPARAGPSGVGKDKARRQPPPAAASPPPVSSQTAGPRKPEAPTASWATVTGRKRRKKKAPPQEKPGPKPGPKTGPKAGPTADPKASSRANPRAGAKGGPKPAPARLPTSAAITVTVPEGSDLTLAAVMATAKARIKLADIGVDMVRSKKAITGGLILEVSGPDCTSKADTLAERMRVALADLGVRVARPVKTGELRLKDLDDSVTPREVLVAVAEFGGCSTDDVRVGDIRRSPTALGTVWVRCPLACVRKLAAAGHIVVGWVSARVDYLTSRPLQCFRCLEYGHVRSMCQSAVDRSTLCYACGEPDHRASRCTRPPRCPLCSDKGCRADHRMGSKRCSPPKEKRKPGPPPPRSAPAPEAKAAPTKGAAQSGQSPPPQEAMEAS